MIFFIGTIKKNLEGYTTNWKQCYLRGSMWDFRSRRGETKFYSSYFPLLDSSPQPPPNNYDVLLFTHE